MVSKKLRGLAAFGMIAAVTMSGVGLAGVRSVQAADPTTVIVTEDDVVRQIHGTPPTNDWVIFTRDTGTGIFTSGPATPPLGVGSLTLTTTTSNDKVYAFNYDHKGTELAEIDAISYSTYRTAGSLQQVAALNIEVDYNGPDAAGGYTVLVFEPVYNLDQGPVVSGQWQDWDAYNGGDATWWSSRAIPGVCAFSCYVSWNDILASNPDATIVNGFGVNQGGGNPGLTTSVDALTLGYGGTSVTYDFEPYRVASSKEQCKNGGWQSMKRADGTSFQNQGDCVSYVSNGK